MSIAIEIGSTTFSTKEAAIEHCRAILYRDPLGTEIVGTDAAFVEALFYMRADKVAELNGRKIARYLRKMHRHNTPCFFAVVEDGDLIDFSYMKFINAYPKSALPRTPASLQARA